jgi:APA family basic amino acid/polyamine antiporter
MATAKTRVAESGSGYFIRNATGLVREMSAFDSFIVGFGLLNVMLGLAETFAFAPYVFPGASVALAFVIGGAFALVLGYLYAALSATMPRSGGDYVWTSRILWGWLGFAVNFFFTLENIAFIAINSWFLCSWFIPALLWPLGLTGLANWFSSLTGAAIIGVPIIGGLVWVYLRGLHTIKRVLVAVFILNMIGLAVWFILMATTDPSQVAANLNAAVGANTYPGVMSAASRSGFHVVTSLVGRNQWLMVIFATQSFFGFQQIGYFAGEIKRVRRAAIQSVGLAWGLGVILFVGGSLLVVHAFGNNFIQDAAYLFNSDPSKYHVPTGGFLSGLSLFLTTNKALQFIVALGFVSSMLWILPAGMMIVTRNMFAWSFDRILPDWMAKVGDRTHSPTNATLVAGGLAYVFLLLTLYTAFWSYIINLTAMAETALIIVSLAAIILPWRRPDIFATAPGIVTHRILGVPLITWGGSLNLVIVAVIAGLGWSTPALGGAIAPASLISSASMFVVAFPIYWISRMVNHRRGFDLSLANKVLPPE